MMTIPSSGGAQETICLPLRKVSGWLMTIEIGRVRPELRERILAYQNECDEVLWRYWSGQTVARPAPKAAAREAPKAGPFTLDDRFVAMLYVALGRKPVQTEVIRRLLERGGPDEWMRVRLSHLAQDPPRISRSTVYKAMHLLSRRGLLEWERGEGLVWVDSAAIERLIERVADLPEALAVALVGDLKEALALPGPERKKLLH